MSGRLEADWPDLGKLHAISRDWTHLYILLCLLLATQTHVWSYLLLKLINSVILLIRC